MKATTSSATRASRSAPASRARSSASTPVTTGRPTTAPVATGPATMAATWPQPPPGTVASGDARDDRGRDDRTQDDRIQDGRTQDGRARGDADAAQRNGNGRAPEWEPRGEQGERADQGARADRRPRIERAPAPEIAGQRRADPPVAGESLEARAEAVLEADAPLPRRRGRPRRDEARQEGDAAGAAPVFEADRLPPSLTAAVADADIARDRAAAADAAGDSSDDAPKPRRRRTRGPAAEAPAAE